MIGFALGMTLAHSQQLDPLPTLIAAGVCSLAARLPDVDIRLKLKHRSMTHSLIALALVLLVCWYVAPVSVIYVGGGYISHLLADALTPYGVPLLYPLRWRFRLARFRTGGRVDQLVGVLAALVILLFAFNPLTQYLNFIP